ncbi:hypothetical protein M569_11990, partial [Genlisea aurea]
ISTFIVGHNRYGSKEGLHTRLRICLQREPENAWDQNALKVLYADQGYNDILGYIPRELAQCLSPLIDKFRLNFEGHITSIPENSRGVIPIQIVSKDLAFCDQAVSLNTQEFKCLWKNLMHAVKLGKRTIYQRNLILLIQQVLRSNSHLFTVSEISFLEAFVSLPEDSQKLFSRLYTRKGPWFRISKLSYAEISDCYQAVKGLLESGYVCTSHLTNELEMEQVLNTLTLSELREALGPHKKKCCRSSRKQDMIELIMSSFKDGLSCELKRFIIATSGSCIKVSPLAETLIWRTERLFFLNGEQDLSSFLLIDLGIVKYPNYRCIDSRPIFSKRSDLISFEEAIEVAQIAVECVEQNKSALFLRCLKTCTSRMITVSEEGKSSCFCPETAFSMQFSASWVYSKVVLLGVSFLESDKRYRESSF